MLQQSLGELQLTVDELEKRMDGLDDESNGFIYIFIYTDKHRYNGSR